MRIIVTAILLSPFFWGAVPSLGEPNPNNCTGLSNDVARLSCFDAIYPPGSPTPEHEPVGTGNWLISSDTSTLTDEKNVFLQLSSEEPIPSRYGGNAFPGGLIIRCMENTTAVVFRFNGRFMADIQGYGRIEYRLDDLQMARINTTESTDNKALGLWSGGRSIPFIKKMLAHDRMIIRATPFNESQITLTYNISGLGNAIAELRETCHW